jgi:beta-lactam-binding protein with PASTA domain
MIMGNYIGMDFLAATATLNATGLVATAPNEVKIKSGGMSQMGVVIAQSIASGATVSTGQTVTFTVNKPFGQFPASEQNEPIPYWYFLQ